MKDDSEERPDELAAVLAVETAYDTAWNTGDVDSILRLMTTDVVVTNPSGETAIGREEVGRSLAELFQGPAKGSTHSSDISAIRLINPGVALVDGEATISDFGAEAQPLRHSFTDVLVRTDAGWRIAQVRAYVFAPKPRLDSRDVR